MDTHQPAAADAPSPVDPAFTTDLEDEIGTLRLFSGLRTVSLCTLLSRVLGMIRDVGMASLFGNGVVMDAFSVAFRVPNLARRLFGEGALTAAFLPAFVREMEHSGRPSAWQLASAVLTVLTVGLSGLVLLGMVVLGCIPLFWQTSAEADLLIGLTVVLLPYLVLICLAAQVSAVLHALGHFTWPAFYPVVMNAVWIAAIWLLAPWFTTQEGQVYAISASILAAGVLQLAGPWPALRRLGFRYDPGWRAARGKVADIMRAIVPVLFGLSVTQLNSLADSLIAWGFSQPEAAASDSTSTLLWGTVGYPLEAGTASALYFGQRMYQFPLGVFGVALGTVMFPLLARHAERGRLDWLREDLTLGLRLVLVVGVPASLGLVLLADPVITLIFEHGAFDADDARQTAAMTAAYGVAVWAYSALLIVHRGYYAAGDRDTPLRVGLIVLALNLVLNFTLIWPFGGPGLALATAISAVVQVVVITWLVQHRIGSLQWRPLLHTGLKAAAATAVMGAVCLMTLNQFPQDEQLWDRFLRVFMPFAAAVLTYTAMARLLGMNELGLLLRHQRRD